MVIEERRTLLKYLDDVRSPFHDLVIPEGRPTVRKRLCFPLLERASAELEERNAALSVVEDRCLVRVLEEAGVCLRSPRLRVPTEQNLSTKSTPTGGGVKLDHTYRHAPRQI